MAFWEVNKPAFVGISSMQALNSPDERGVFYGEMSQ
jgi:hypothetical protein